MRFSRGHVLEKYSICRNNKGMLNANDGEVPTFGELVLSPSYLNPCGVWTVERAYIVETRGIVTDLRSKSSGQPVEVCSGARPYYIFLQLVRSCEVRCEIYTYYWGARHILRLTCFNLENYDHVMKRDDPLGTRGGLHTTNRFSICVSTCL